jgi:polyisoprenoid-binding protein YceI
MAIPTGTFVLGPDDGTLSVHTGRGGAAAKAGHDLRIEVATWSATLAVADDPARCSVQLTADSTSLRVIEGTGGMATLDEDDKSNIATTIDEEILKRTTIAFRSASVSAAENGSGRLRVEGELELAGATAPIAFDLDVGEGRRLTGRAVVTQTAWGLKPYSTLFGALKVLDDVEVSIDALLPSST